MFLIELLETCPHYLGEQEAIGDLPFMFKVLSINKALSIQVGAPSLFLPFRFCLYAGGRCFLLLLCVAHQLDGRPRRVLLTSCRKKKVGA